MNFEKSSQTCQASTNIIYVSQLTYRVVLQRERRDMSTNQIYRFAFTWNHQDGWDEDVFKKAGDYLNETMKDYAAKYIFQLEKVSRLHYQGYFSMATKRTCRNVIKYMEEKMLEGIHIRPCSAAGTEALKRYCMKEESRVAGPWMDKDTVEEKRPMKLFERPKGRTERNLEEKDFYPWQKALKEEWLRRPDLRTIRWIWDAAGGHGKTQFAIYAQVEWGAHYITYVTVKDMLYSVASAARDSTVIILDLSRVRPQDIVQAEVYAAIEVIKNAVFTVGKFKSTNFEMNTPHVCVFANHSPDRSQLSQDRWVVSKIDPVTMGLVLVH